MEQSAKILIWIVTFITLPITIPLAIISIDMVITVIMFVLSIFMMAPGYGTIFVVILLVYWQVHLWLHADEIS